MKKVLLLAVVFSFGLSFTSCKKCSTCTYTAGGQTVTSPEVCGSSSEIDDYESQQEAAATAAGAQVNCVRK